MSSDHAFVGSIPAIYDRYLGPMLFEPYALDMAARFRGFDGALLEIAAGTGRVTRALEAAAAPGARIVATDLNEAMLTEAARLVPSPRIEWRQADAQQLPFETGGFDAVVCQFGVMFFPDKAAGYAEARRVLKPGGRYVFSVWDRLDANALTLVVQQTMTRLFPDDPPRFFERVPFGYAAPDAIRRALAEAGFGDIAIETVTVETRAESAEAAAAGLCKGSPLAGEIEARDAEGLERVTAAVARALADRFGAGPIAGQGQALVVTAR